MTVEPQPCPECDGLGWIAVAAPRCCQRSEWECGGRGCTGPEPDQEQEQCEFCRGSGTVEDDGEEIPPFDDAHQEGYSIVGSIAPGNYAHMAEIERDSRLEPLVETGTGSIREADESGGAEGNRPSATEAQR